MHSQIQQILEENQLFYPQNQTYANLSISRMMNVENIERKKLRIILMLHGNSAPFVHSNEIALWASLVSAVKLLPLV
jgi:hypothetical protein